VSASSNPLTPTYRPDVEEVYWKMDTAFRQYNFFTFPFHCPVCGYFGEYIALVPRRATQKEFEESMALHQRELTERTVDQCPVCRKRKADRGASLVLPGMRGVG
jgi:hypothetical protein